MATAMHDGSIQRHTRAKQESYQGLSAIAIDGTRHVSELLGEPGWDARPASKNDIHDLQEGV